MAGELLAARLLHSVAEALEGRVPLSQLEQSVLEVVVQTNHRVNVSSEATIEVIGFPEPIELVRLRRTIGNLRDSIALVHEWALNRPSEPNPEQGRKNVSALNHLVRSRRTLETLAMLFKSDEVRSPLRDIVEDEEITGTARQQLESELFPDDSTIVVYYDHKEQEKLAFLLAEVFRQIKNGRDNMGNVDTPSPDDWQQMKTYLSSILMHISTQDNVQIINRGDK